MKTSYSDRAINWLAFYSGLMLSAVAVYYSVAGLISIFSAAVIPIAVMGTALELSKLVATVWLKRNWGIAPALVRSYLLVAILVLMGITSMGIFGYLSKAHLDQGVPSGDVAARLELIDERIRTQKENIEGYKKSLTQLDQQVDQRLARGESEKGAERAVLIRKEQQSEREALKREITSAQAEIRKLSEERAPVAAEYRKVDAEVGPIKYIAALIYGSEARDQDLLERAVRWVIMLIVLTFDPLAVILLLASQYGFAWQTKEESEEEAVKSNGPEEREREARIQSREVGEGLVKIITPEETVRKGEGGQAAPGRVFVVEGLETPRAS